VLQFADALLGVEDLILVFAEFRRLRKRSEPTSVLFADVSAGTWDRWTLVTSI